MERNKKEAEEGGKWDWDNMHVQFLSALLLSKEKSESSGPSVMLPRAVCGHKGIYNVAKRGEKKKNMFFLLKGKFKAYETTCQTRFVLVYK